MSRQHRTAVWGRGPGIVWGLLLGLAAGACGPVFAEPPAAVSAALQRAGENRGELERALAQTPPARRASMEFLVANMPEQDLHTLTAKYLLENVSLAHQAWEQAPWRDAVPHAIFLNDVLPYASVNERRDDWRSDFFTRFRPLIADAQTPSQAAAILNQKVFPLLNVRYSTKRRKPDQSPLESIESGLASCTGLSVVLIDACRAVGVPARFVGTPLWSDGSGNHSWVEVWDKGWQFTGACEATGMDLNKGWFIHRASQAKRDVPRHAIFAVSFRRTPLAFPLVWDRGNRSVPAVNVTDRYTRLREELPVGQARIRFCVRRKSDGERVAAKITLVNSENQPVFEGATNDERFDANDHRTVPLTLRQKYTLRVDFEQQQVTRPITPERPDQLVTVILEEQAAPDGAAAPDDSPAVVAQVTKYLQQDAEKRPPLDDLQWAQTPLTKQDADRVQQLFWEEHVRQLRQTRAEEMQARALRHGDLEMPFFYKKFGEKPPGGRSLYISLHGGGGAPKRVNDQQWENQKRLYSLEEGVYLAPRAPTNTWNLWHQGHIDPLLDRLIENLIVFEDVNPNRVYLLGYSAGGDGVYQVAPRFADRLAAAAMMAGHPNDARPEGLRNLPFTIHVGGKDAAYNRNQVARTWGDQLQALHEKDPLGYVNWVKIYPDKGHWLNREDAAAIPWMAKHERNPAPSRVVWRQDDVTHSRFYWLAVPGEQRKRGTEIRARYDGQRIEVEAEGVKELTVRLNDQMLDLDQPAKILVNGKETWSGLAARTAATIAATLAERGDPQAVFSAAIPLAVASP